MTTRSSVNTTMSSTFTHHLDSLRPFLSLSYPVASTSSTTGETVILYDKGFDDIYIVVACAVTLTVLREMTIRFIVAPVVTAWLRSGESSSRWGLQLSRQAAGLAAGGKNNGNGNVYHVAGSKAKRKEEKKLGHTATRFAEQSWSFLYCCIVWTFGLNILRSVPNYWTPENLWGSYPYTPISGETKLFYLLQLGWWFHQIYVINVEKRRSDHWQMFSHHILTIALMSGSYLTNYTRVGVLVHWLMDLCDIWLPLAKMFRYVSLRTLTDATFVLFLVSWIFTRQIGLFFVIRSAYLDVPRFIQFTWAPERRHYLTPGLYYGFIGMLSILLVFCSVWLMSALKIALMVVSGKGAEDVRSDEEDEGDEVSNSISSEEVIEDISQWYKGEVNGTSNDQEGPAESSAVRNKTDVKKRK